MHLILTSNASNCMMRSSRATSPSSGFFAHIETLDSRSAFSLRSTKQVTYNELQSSAIQKYRIPKKIPNANLQK
jgi:hypothetical protein